MVGIPEDIQVSESIIADDHPHDGRNLDFQCARCGSSVEWHQCEVCGGSGETEPGGLYEIGPLWYDLNDCDPCIQCGGMASECVCLSSPEWCEANPLEGRENVKRGQI